MAEEMRVPLRSSDNQVLGEVSLPPAFCGPVRRHLLYEAVKMQLANRRAGTACTKTRGEVRGGGRKPWRQKGTGRARAGSIRSPLWVGGGTVFGPKPRDYSYRMPRTARRAALASALSLKAREDKLLVVENLDLPEIKTKAVVALLERLGVESGLLVTGEPNETLEKSARNLPRVKVLRVEGINPYDILRYDRLVLTRSALEKLRERWSE
ncbi:MAG: 50S ribosomal protein L4 [Candidatus Binatia bacterium]|nr:MAG: 50S ribosomal protein L4 [Candidatus Binatia bacterium]